MTSKKIFLGLIKAVEDPLAHALGKVAFDIIPLTLLAKFLGYGSLMEIGMWTTIVGVFVVVGRGLYVAFRNPAKVKKLVWLADDISEMILFPYTVLLCLLILLNNGYDYMNWWWVVAACAVLVVVTNHLPPSIARRLGRDIWLRPIDPLTKAFSNASLAMVPVAMIAYFIDNMWLLAGALTLAAGLFVAFLVRVAMLEQEGLTCRGRSQLADRINDFLLFPYNLILALLIVQNNTGHFPLNADFWTALICGVFIFIPARKSRKKHDNTR